jgi:hypothetical protein
MSHPPRRSMMWASPSSGATACLGSSEHEKRGANEGMRHCDRIGNQGMDVPDAIPPRAITTKLVKS